MDSHFVSGQSLRRECYPAHSLILVLACMHVYIINYMYIANNKELPINKAIEGNWHTHMYKCLAKSPKYIQGLIYSHYDFGLVYS